MDIQKVQPLEEDGDFKANLNPKSLETVKCKLEPSLKNAKAEDKFQFERLGYFCVDKDTEEGKLIFNRTVPLRDTWSKKNK